MAITIDEHEDERGGRTRLAIRTTHDCALALVRDDGEAMPLPPGALEAVMKRYGRPLGFDRTVPRDAEPHERFVEEGGAPRDVRELAAQGVSVVESLDLGNGRTLARFRFMSRYDVIARDWLVLFSPDSEALCELATSVAAALDHLARRFSASSG